MTPTRAMTPYCDARTRSGGKCRRPAGWGTPHPRRGRCKLHGGRTRAHVKRAAREEAAEFVVGMLWHEMDVDPLDAALMAVRLAAGSTAFWRRKLADAYEKGEEPTPMQVEGYRAALNDLARITKLANDAGVPDRLSTISERVADQWVMAGEELIAALLKAGVALTIEQRTIAAHAYAAAVQRLEDEPIGGQPRQLAA